MTGISGGGWETVIYAAIDPRIKYSFPVAGSLPLYLRGEQCGGSGHDWGDYEQGGKGGWPAIFYQETASYLDLYLLGSIGDDRKQIQIYNKYDPCCFAGERFKNFEDLLAKKAKTISGGYFKAVADTSHQEHKISDWALREIMLPAINQ